MYKIDNSFIRLYLKTYLNFELFSGSMNVKVGAFRAAYKNCVAT